MIQVESNIPLPPPKGGGHGNDPNSISAILRTIKVGDSFLFPEHGKVEGIYATAKQQNVKVAVRREGERHRVWRVA